jgi:8-oxo-dGTP pyrophosphatase MutT (NUDIX family)
MHRRNLLAAIDQYARRYPEEAAVVQRFTALVENHENCFQRDCWHGHITGSAWLVSPNRQELLLTHHRKLNMWLQLGGHSDGESNTQQVALREAREESGLAVELLDTQIFDLDVHEIPARKTDPAHYHFDVRYQIQAASDQFQVSEESLALAWVKIDELERYTEEESILRMRKKWRQIAKNAE